MDAVVRVQAGLPAAGVPAPAPLAGPLPLGDGWLTVEAHRGGDPALPHVVGHPDWRVQNLAFAGDRVSAVYDWDSVGLVPEPALVGSE